jgi:hypothetical protein
MGAIKSVSSVNFQTDIELIEKKFDITYYLGFLSDTGGYIRLTDHYYKKLTSGELKL